MNMFQGILRGATPRIRWLPLAAGSLVLFSGLAQSYAQPRGAPQSSVVQGTVERMTAAPRGEIDGAVLSEGTWLHWPPHMQDRFANAVREGDRVRATGRTETGPAGHTHFEVEAVTNLRTNVATDNPDYAFGPPPPPAFRGRGRRGPPPRAFGPGRGMALRNQAATSDMQGSATAENPDYASGPPLPPRGPRGRGMRFAPPPPPAVDRRPTPVGDGNDAVEVQGTVQRMTTAPRGEMDGAILDDGTWVHWPPHMQDRFADVVKEGDRVQATGKTETGPAGDTHFEVQSVTNLRTNSTAENPDFINGPAAVARRAVADDVADREQRLRDLQNQIDRLQRDIERLRSQR